MSETGTKAGIVPVFCINLAKRQDRWKDFMAQEGLRGLDIKRWEATEGNTLDILGDSRVSMRVKRNIQKKLRRSWDDIYTPGAIGCYISHVEIWKWLSKSDHESCIVLEDDCVVPADFSEKIRNLWEESEIIRANRFDCCILHRKCGKVAETVGQQSDDKVEPLEWFFNTTGYIITRNCAKRLLEAAYPIQVHVDKYIGLHKYIFNLRLYRVREEWLNITSSGSDSDIDSKYCDFCDIPSDFTKTHKAMGLWDFYFGRASQVVALGVLGWLGLKRLGITK